MKLLITIQEIQVILQEILLEEILEVISEKADKQEEILVETLEVILKKVAKLEEILEERTEPTIFRVSGFDVPVHDETLARALLSLTPQRRSILLLAYFLHETDEDIARDLKLSRSAVQRRRASALELMRQMMGGVAK